MQRLHVAAAGVDDQPDHAARMQRGRGTYFKVLTPCGSRLTSSIFRDFHGHHTLCGR